MEIQIKTHNGVNVVSSIVIAEQLGKRHSNIIRDIENILTNSNLSSLILESEYIDKKGESRKEYLLTKDGFTLYMFNIQGYNEFKMAYINRFNEMENYINKVDNKLIEENIRLKKELEHTKLLINEESKKATYYDIVSKFPYPVLLETIASDFTLKLDVLVNTLIKLNVIEINRDGEYVLTNKHENKEFTVEYEYTNNLNNMGTVKIKQTYWTPKGRLFLYELLSSHKYVARVDRVYDFKYSF